MAMTPLLPMAQAASNEVSPNASVPVEPNAVQVDWVQCRNDMNNDNVPDNPDLCTWVTGSLNAQNSILTEGNNPLPYPPNIPGHVNYRGIFEGLIAGTYELTIEYDFSKGGKIAFDFLTTNYGVSNANLCEDLPTGVTTAACTATVTAGPSAGAFPFDYETISGTLGGGDVEDRQAAHDAAMPAPDRTAKVYGATIGTITLGTRSGSETSDSKDAVTIEFVKTTGEGAFVMITWGGHFGIGLPHPIGYGPGKGAGSISGAPFHMRIDKLIRTTAPTSGNVLTGQRDRSVQPGALTFQQIKVVKDAVPDDPQDFEFAGSSPFGTFYLDDDPGDNTLPNFKIFSLSPGTYSVSETLPPGWVLTSATCSDGSPINAIVLSADESITCTFVNTKKATLIIAKDAVPNDPQDFEFAPSFGSNFFLDDDPASPLPSQAAFDLSAGTYSVDEVNIPSDWDLTSATCTDGSPVSAIVLSAGETVTCTFENTKRGRIIVEKQTDPDGAAGTFTFSGAVSGSIGDGGQIVSGYLQPGTHLVTEADPTPGFDLTSVSCDDANSSGDTGTRTATVQLEPGETVTCTFTNTKRAKLIVEKQTLPNGDPASFTFSGEVSGSIGDDGQLTKDDVPPGTYTVTETVPTGWDLTSIVCDDNDSTGNTLTATATFKLQPGETVKCTFTNTKRAKLIVEKQTLPDGSPETFAFSGAASGSIGDGGQITVDDLVPGTYVVKEEDEAGWDLISIVCDDTDSSGDTGTREATFELSPGETVKCTFTNRQRAKLIVEKQTNPDNAPGTFSFSGTASGSIGDGGQITVSNLVPGTYTSTEANPTPQFDLTSIVCDDNDSSGNVATRTATFELSPGETVKCTFTNTQRGNIVIDKVTKPSGDPQSFSFTLTGGPDGINQPFSLADASTPHDSGLVKPGTYAASEVVPAGWDLTLTSCTDSSPVGAIVLSPGESVTCTFENTKRGRITIDKVTLPSGDPQSFDFTLTGGPDDLDEDFSLADASTPFDSGLVKPGTYTAQETVPTGWDLTDIDCDDSDSEGDEPSATATIELSPGEEVTCTFTNTKRGKILVDKVTLPSADPKSFSFSLTGGPDGLNVGFSLTDQDAPFDSGLIKPGTYSAAETVPTGWDLTSATCDDGSNPASVGLSPGETVTCTFTNTKRGRITVDKVTVPTGDLQEFDFTLTGGPDSLDVDFSLADQDNPFDSGLIKPGTYGVSEGVLPDWDLTGATCDDGSNPANIGLSPGEEVTCTFTNTKRGKILVDKETDPAGDPQVFSFTLTGGPDAINQAFGLADATAPHSSGFVKPGTYAAAEGALPDWDLTGATCDDGSDPASIGLSPGETVTCTFENTKRGTILVDKVTLPAGEPQVFDFTLTGGPDAINQAFGLADATAPHSSGFVKPGTYSVSELVPAGWDLTGATCDDDSDPASIDLSPGETVTCTFENTKRGKVIVVKQTDPDGAAGLFTFEGTPAGLISDDGQIELEVVPGQYATTEADPTPQFDLTGIACDDGASAVPSTFDVPTRTATYNVEPGEIVTCTFTNTQRSQVTILKKSYKGDGKFTFTLQGGNLGPPLSFSITTSEGTGTTFFYLVPGSYSVTETIPPGWTLISQTCDNGDAPSALSLDPGEVVVCEFVNFRPSKVTDSALCDFDRDENTLDQEFRLIFTNDPGSAGWKATATNPGQTYFHIFLNGDPGDAAAMTIRIPYPYVTQGANPWHAYSSVSVEDNCFIPGDEVKGIWSVDNKILTIDEHSPQAVGGYIDVLFTGTYPDTGVLYVNVHLDFGLKQTGNYGKNAANDATDLTTGLVVLPEHSEFEFACYVGGDLVDAQSVYNMNDFKGKAPGFGGMVKDEFGNGLPGETVSIYRPDGSLLGIAVTDADGLFFYPHKHTGPAATYKLSVLGKDTFVSVASNAYVWVSIVIP